MIGLACKLLVSRESGLSKPSKAGGCSQKKKATADLVGHQVGGGWVKEVVRSGSCGQGVWCPKLIEKRALKKISPNFAKV